MIKSYDMTESGPSQRTLFSGIHLSSLSILIMTIPFIKALINPTENMDFIYNQSFYMFLSEFFLLQIQAAATQSSLTIKILNKPHVIKDKKMSMLISYFFIGALFFAITKEIGLTLYLFLAMFFNLISHSDKLKNIDSNLAVSVISFLASMFLSIILGLLLTLFFPLPQELASYNHTYDGLFSEYPYTILLWGIIYPLTVILSQAKIEELAE